MTANVTEGTNGQAYESEVHYEGDVSGKLDIIMGPADIEPPIKVSFRLRADADKISALALSRLVNKSGTGGLRIVIRHSAPAVHELEEGYLVPTRCTIPAHESDNTSLAAIASLRLLPGPLKIATCNVTALMAAYFVARMAGRNAR